MQKKHKQLLLVPFILVIAVIISLVLAGQKEPAGRRPSKAAQKRIQIIDVVTADIDVPMRLTGPVTAYNRAELYAEVTGLLLDTQKRLKTGNRYRKGELMVHIDDRIYRNTVLSQKSSLMNQITQLIPDLSIDYPESAAAWKRYLEAFDLNSPAGPLPEPASVTEKYYIASRNIYTHYYSVKSMEENLAKYRIRAPFDGVVTDAQINPGTLVRSGTRIASFTGSGHYEMEAAATARQVRRLALGQTAVLRSEDIEGEFRGRVTRINTVLDPSQMFRVYIESKDNRLKDGLYLSALITAEPVRDAVMIPKTILEKNSRVYTVETGKLILTPVLVAAETGDQVVVQGLKNGQKVLGEKIIGAREGLPFAPQQGPADSRAGGGAAKPAQGGGR